MPIFSGPDAIYRPAGWRRRLGCLLALCAILGCVATGLFIALQVWRWNCRRDVDRQLTELRTRGVPTTAEELEASYMLPPGAEDCTQLWLDAITPLVAAKEEWDQSDIPMVDSDGPDPPLPGDDWPQAAEAEALLARHRDSLDMMHEAARRGGAARYPTGFAAGADAKHDDLQGIKLGTRLLQLEAFVHAHRGQKDRALESLAALDALARSLSKRPDTVAYLVRLAVRNCHHRMLLRVLPVLKLSDAELATLQDRCQRMERDGQAVLAVRGERIATLIQFEKPLDIKDKVVSHLDGPTGPSDLAYYLETIARIEEALQPSPPASLTACKRIDAEIVAEAESWRRLGRVMSLVMLPAFEAIAIAEARALAERDGTIILLAAERYRLRHGESPAELADLTPDFIAEAPRDPFDGQPLRYRVDDDGVCVYSVGRDQQDDSGDDDPRNGDIVFRIPRRKPAVKMDDQDR